MPANFLPLFPAPAGMNRVFWELVVKAISVPRASGDEPASKMALPSRDSCSPRQRG